MPFSITLLPWLVELFCNYVLLNFCSCVYVADRGLAPYLFSILLPLPVPPQVTSRAFHIVGILQTSGKGEVKGFCLMVFLGQDDHTLGLRFVGRLERDYRTTWPIGDGGMPTPCLTG